MLVDFSNIIKQEVETVSEFNNKFSKAYAITSPMFREEEAFRNVFSCFDFDFGFF